jgi:multiple sugar transport system ATP-binding protein
MASLQFQSVGKRFSDGVLALANVDLDIRDGEFLVLVGPSGCGKTTLLRLAAGLETLTDGRIMIGGRDVSAMPPGDRDIAMVFQNYALYPHMDVYENMAFGLGQRSVPKAVIKKKIENAARILHVTPYLRRKLATLSGGQRQRVAMGRAIVRDPQCFLMDEPLSNLDAKLRVQMRAELKLLNTQLGVTTLYVTHDQVEAMTMGDRVAVLRPVSDPGETNLQQCGAPRDIYENPANMFVAAFIGSPAMNFLPARLVREEAGVVLENAKLAMRWPMLTSVLERRPGLAAWVGRDLIVGVRPEAFRLQPLGLGGLGGEVILIEMTGPDAYVFLDLPVSWAALGADPADEEITRDGKTRVTIRVQPASLPNRGQRISFDADMDRVLFFDPASGQAIR